MAKLTQEELEELKRINDEGVSGGMPSDVPLPPATEAEFVPTHPSFSPAAQSARAIGNRQEQAHADISAFAELEPPIRLTNQPFEEVDIATKIKRGISGGLAGAPGGPIGMAASAIVNADPQLRANFKHDNPTMAQFLLAEDPAPEMAAFAAQTLFDRAFRKTPLGIGATIAGRTLAGGTGGLVGGFTEVAFGNKTIEMALESAENQAVGGLLGGVIGGAGQAIFGRNQNAATVKLLDRLEKRGFPEFRQGSGYSVSKGPLQGMRKFFSSVYGGGKPFRAEADRFAKNFANAINNRFGFGKGRNILSTPTKTGARTFEPDSIEGRLRANAAKVAEKAVLVTKIEHKINPKTGRTRQEITRSKRAMRAGDTVFINPETGQIKAFEPNHRQQTGVKPKAPEGYVRIKATHNEISPRSFTEEEMAEVSALVNSNPGSFLKALNPFDDAGLPVWRSFMSILSKKDRRFFQQQAINKWVIGPAVGFNPQGATAGGTVDSPTSISGAQIRKQIGKFGPEKLNQAFDEGTAEALLDMAELMDAAGFSGRLQQRAGETQLSYAFNKASFGLNSRIANAVMAQGSGGAVAGALATKAGLGIAATAGSVVGGLVVILPIARGISAILDNPRFVDTLVGAANGNGAAVSRMMVMLASEEPDEQPKMQMVPNANGKGKTALMVFPPPGGGSAPAPPQPPTLENLLRN